jgi:molecular chaperone DnaK
MTITGQSSLARDDIERMVKDAEAHAEEDRRRRDEAEVRNQADTLVYQTEKLLKEQGDKLSGDEKSAVEDKLGDLKAALGGSDTDAIRNATDALMAASQSFTQKLYEAASQEGAAAGATGGSTGATDQPSDDDVVDAEIVDDEEGSSS